MSPNNNSDDNSFSDETCVVCFKNVDIYSIGDCDHPVCHQCSTKMRVLCKKNECPICRHDMQKVIFTKCKQPFKDLERSIGSKYLIDRKFQIIFETTTVQNAYNYLLAHVCSVCPSRRAFQTFVGLKDHVRKEHELFFCDLCVENLKILTHERRCYTRKELATHKRLGDEDDRSHRGHPICEFCNERYMDNDELYRHLRRDHLYCHFCDADGLHQYYESYEFLRDHFRDQHYLCEEGDCFNEKFTSAFRSDIDLKAHRASVHGRQMTKAAAKQARTLELEFTLKPRVRQSEARQRGGGRNSRHYANTGSDEEEGAVGGMAADSRSQQARPAQTFVQLNTASKDDFPSLGGSNAAPSVHNFHKPGSRGAASRAGGSLAMTEADFPALAGDSAPTTSVSVRVNSVSVADRTKGGSKPNVSIHVNHRPNSITATVSRDHFPALQPTAKPVNYSASAKSTNISVSAPQWTTVKSKQPAPPPQPQKKKPYRYDEDDYTVLNDFPALGGNISSHISSLAATQWSSGREAEAKVTVEKNKQSQPPPPKPPQPKTFHIEDDFPSLTSRFDASCSVQQEPKPPGKKQPESKPKKESSISISVDNEWTKVKKSASNTDNISSDSDIGSKKSNKKKKNKSKTKSEPESAKSNSAKNNNNNNEAGKKNKQKDEHKSKAKQIKVDDKNKIEQPKGETSNLSSSSGESLERKRSELKIENLNGQEESVNMDMGEFPSLSNRTPPGFSNMVKEKTPAPPGFGTSSNPPPGFSITLNSVARPPSNGLTFTSSSGQNYAIPSGDGNGSGRVFNYVSPLNVKNRNTALLNQVTEALGTQAALDEFLQKSFMFRQGFLPAEMYHGHCREAMGAAAFDTIFPELLVLLPDIAKQQELWKVAEQQSSWRLQVCAACGQVVGGSDFKHHLGTHSLENHFPALSNGSGPSRPNAWTDK